MGGRGAIGRSAYVAALLAVVLFSFATVRSVVMQVAMAGPAGMAMPICGHATPAPSAHRDHGKAAKACEYCAAAAHAPICESARPVSRSASLTWTAYAELSPLGPRGPPAFEAKSRGPPHSTPTL